MLEADGMSFERTRHTEARLAEAVLATPTLSEVNQVRDRVSLS
jgi:hypothetical protein